MCMCKLACVYLHEDLALEHHNPAQSLSNWWPYYPLVLSHIKAVGVHLY